MIVNVNWYKTNGKWYAQEDVEIGTDFEAFEPEQVLAKVIENQTALVAGAHSEMVITVENKDYDDRFVTRLYPIGINRPQTSSRPCEARVIHQAPAQTGQAASTSAHSWNGLGGE